MPLDERSPQPLPPPALSEPAPDGSGLAPIPIPVISRTPASPTSTTADDDDDTESQTLVMPSRRARVAGALAHAAHVLFPTLHGFWAKPLLGKVAAVLAAPAVMALTLTLPVVVTAYDDAGAAAEKHRAHAAGGGAEGGEGRLIDFEEEGVERALIAEEEVEEEMHELGFNKWLMAVQCCFGPLFCVVVLFGASSAGFVSVLLCGR